MIEGIHWDFEKDGDKLSQRAAQQAISNLMLYNSFMCIEFDDAECQKSIKFLRKCKKAFDALFAEKIEKLEGGECDELFEDRL